MEVRRLPSDALEHHGVKGQHWGERRWQNEDGSLTAAGRLHYGYGESIRKKIDSDYEKRKDKMSKSDSAEITVRREQRNKRETAAAVAGVGLAATTIGKANLIKGAIKSGAEKVKSKLSIQAVDSALQKKAVETAVDKWKAASDKAFDSFGTSGYDIAQSQAEQARKDLVKVQRTTSSPAANIKPIVSHAISYCNPIALSVAASAAITLTGYAIYNHYKNKKLKEIHEDYQIPNSTKVRKV